MIEVSVIIVNYNTTEEAIRCIRSVKDQTEGVGYEIILVDNNSTDRAVEGLQQLFPGIIYIQNPENLGFGIACTRAVESATGVFCFFLNPDTILKNNALFLFSRFWKQYEGELSISCLGTQMENEKGEPVHSSGTFPAMSEYLRQKAKSLFNRITGSRVRETLPEYQETYRAVDYVTGADLFLSKENFVEAGGFDPVFFMYFEETDLQFRLSKAGKQSYLINGPLIGHAQYKSFKGNTKLQRVLYLDSMLRYFKKHYPSSRFFLFKLCWYLLDLRTLVQKIFISSKPG